MAAELHDTRSPSIDGRGDDERIRRSLARLEKALGRASGFGRATNTSTTTLIDELRCLSAEGAHSIETDLPKGLGGSGSAPTPGVLLRAALGSCLAMGYRMRLARHGVPVRSIRVDVESDSELDGMIRPTSGSRPGFSEIRYHVQIESDAPVADVARIVEEADSLSPMLDAIGRANRLCRSLSITGGAG